MKWAYATWRVVKITHSEFETWLNDVIEMQEQGLHNVATHRNNDTQCVITHI